MSAEPSAEAKAVVDDLLFDDAADHAASIGALALRVGTACERRDLGAAQRNFGLLRLAGIALADDLKRLDTLPPDPNRPRPKPKLSTSSR
jgi:hypothetical protein